MTVVSAFFESILVNLTKSTCKYRSINRVTCQLFVRADLQENMSTIMTLYKTFKAMLDVEVDMRGIGLSLIRRLLVLAEKVCKASTSAVKTLKNAAIIEQVFEDENTEVTLTEFLQELKAVAVAAQEWTNKNRANLVKASKCAPSIK